MYDRDSSRPPFLVLKSTVGEVSELPGEGLTWCSALTRCLTLTTPLLDVWILLGEYALYSKLNFTVFKLNFIVLFLKIILSS